MHSGLCGRCSPRRASLHWTCWHGCSSSIPPNASQRRRRLGIPTSPSSTNPMTPFPRAATSFTFPSVTTRGALRCLAVLTAGGVCSLDISELTRSPRVGMYRQTVAEYRNTLYAAIVGHKKVRDCPQPPVGFALLACAVWSRIAERSLVWVMSHRSFGEEISRNRTRNRTTLPR
jgi:hypothetical protein